MSESNRVILRAVQEATLGTTPVDSANWFEIRHTSDTVSANPRNVISDEILSNRQTQDLIKTGLDVTGQVSFEQSHESHDTLWQAAFCNAWSANVLKIGTTEYGFTVEKEFSDLSFSGTLSGTTGAGQALVNDASVTIGQTTIDLDDTSLTGTIVAGDSFTVAGDTQIYTCLTTGTASGNAISALAFTPAAEVAWANNAVVTLIDAKYIALKGMRCDGFTATWEYGRIVNGSFNFMGTGKSLPSTSLVGAGSVATRVTKTPFDASSGLTTMTIDGGGAGITFRRLQLNLVNGLRPLEGMGFEAPVDMELGEAQVTGSLQAYMSGTGALYSKVIDGQAFTLAWTTTDVDGNTFAWSLPNCKALSGPPDTPGKNQTVMIDMQFRALYDSSSATTIQLTRSA